MTRRESMPLIYSRHNYQNKSILPISLLVVLTFVFTFGIYFSSRQLNNVDTTNNYLIDDVKLNIQAHTKLKNNIESIYMCYSTDNYYTNHCRYIHLDQQYNYTIPSYQIKDEIFINFDIKSYNYKNLSYDIVEILIKLNDRKPNITKIYDSSSMFTFDIDLKYNLSKIKHNTVNKHKNIGHKKNSANRINNSLAIVLLAMLAMILI